MYLSNNLGFFYFKYKMLLCDFLWFTSFLSSYVLGGFSSTRWDEMRWDINFCNIIEIVEILDETSLSYSSSSCAWKFNTWFSIIFCLNVIVFPEISFKVGETELKYYFLYLSSNNICGANSPFWIDESTFSTPFFQGTVLLLSIENGTTVKRCFFCT